MANVPELRGQRSCKSNVGVVAPNQKKKKGTTREVGWSMRPEPGKEAREKSGLLREMRSCPSIESRLEHFWRAGVPPGDRGKTLFFRLELPLAIALISMEELTVCSGLRSWTPDLAVTNLLP